MCIRYYFQYFFFFQAEDGIRDPLVTGVQTCALPIYSPGGRMSRAVFLPASRSCRSRQKPKCHKIGRASCRERCRTRGWAYQLKKNIHSECHAEYFEFDARQALKATFNVRGT